MSMKLLLLLYQPQMPPQSGPSPLSPDTAKNLPMLHHDPGAAQQLDGFVNLW